MVRFFSAKCPHCGGEFQAPEGTSKAFCIHCGRQILVDEYDQRTRVDVFHHDIPASVCKVCKDIPITKCQVCGADLCSKHLWYVRSNKEYGGSNIRSLCKTCATNCVEERPNLFSVVHVGEDIDPSSMCPKCGGLMVLIKQYNRLFCYECKKYR